MGEVVTSCSFLQRPAGFSSRGFVFPRDRDATSLLCHHPLVITPIRISTSVRLEIEICQFSRAFKFKAALRFTRWDASKLYDAGHSSCNKGQTSANIWSCYYGPISIFTLCGKRLRNVQFTWYVLHSARHRQACWFRFVGPRMVQWCGWKLPLLSFCSLGLRPGRADGQLLEFLSSCTFNSVTLSFRT